MIGSENAGKVTVKKQVSLCSLQNECRNIFYQMPTLQTPSAQEIERHYSNLK